MPLFTSPYGGGPATFFNVRVVSARSRRAMYTFSLAHLKRTRKSCSVQPISSIRRILAAGSKTNRLPC